MGPGSDGESWGESGDDGAIVEEHRMVVVLDKVVNLKGRGFRPFPNVLAQAVLAEMDMFHSHSSAWTLLTGHWPIFVCFHSFLAGSTSRFKYFYALCENCQIILTRLVFIPVMARLRQSTAEYKYIWTKT
jgi:hypothetical protein